MTQPVRGGIASIPVAVCRTARERLEIDQGSHIQGFGSAVNTRMSGMEEWDDPHQLPQFDFDEWMQLARKDPEAFERRRTALLERAIQCSPPARQRRLRGLQCRIDLERERSKNPLQACVRISEIMMRFFAEEFRPALDCDGNADDRIQAQAKPTNAERPKALSDNVIPFRPKGRRN